MTTKEKELFEECKIQLIHIHDVVGRKQFGSTKDVIKQIEQVLAIPNIKEEKELFCHHEGSYTLKEDGTCCKCHRFPNH
tara:strand:- start:1019 stop:1255 length:237 start_codon:yes stop_codon:yes gene_type:complete